MWILGNPQSLWLLIGVLGILIWVIFSRRSRSRAVLMPFPAMTRAIRRRSRATRAWLALLFAGTIVAAICLGVAASRPIELESLTSRIAEGIDIVLVLDVSESMEADDFPPSRIVVAKNLIQDFIRKRSDDRIGIVTFGGEAVTKSPLTRDHEFLLQQVEDIRLRELKQGTAIGMGLTAGIARLRRPESRSKVIILLTDGDSNVGSINPITAAHLARQEGIRIYSIGIGKENRVVVPLYAYDLQGRRLHQIAQVPSYINPALLKEISRVTNANAYMARSEGALTRVLQEIDQYEKKPVRLKPTQKRHELFWIPAWIAFGLLCIVIGMEAWRFPRRRRGHAVPT